MNILIITGGTGSIALQNGLKSYSKKIKITSLVNAYDDGKSTGVCKQIMNVLGPSDIRKNQYTQWKNKGLIDKRIIDLFEKRWDNLTYEDAINYIADCNFDNKYFQLFSGWLYNFFIRISLQEKLNDFNLANIIYSAAFSDIGYDATIETMKEFLNIEDDVILNSTEYACLKAITERGSVIETEGEIVNYNNSEDKIRDVYLTNGIGSFVFPKLTFEANEAIFFADIIIFSAGTQWSSLIPTYQTRGFREAINNTKAKKYLVMNNEEDGDMKGRTSDFILNEVGKYIDLNKVTVIYNCDANIKSITPARDYLSEYLGNDNGKHFPKKLASLILRDYYNIFNINNKGIMSDFDDTLFSRNENDKEVSFENIKLFNLIALNKNCSIVSGNSFNRIKNKISSEYGLKLDDINFRIFCDGGLVEYKYGKIIRFYSDYMMNFHAVKRIHEELDEILKIKLNVEYRGIVNEDDVSCFSITKLEKNYRELLWVFLQYYLKDENVDIKKTGLGTIDIFMKGYNKSKIFEMLNFSPENFVYIGDEIDKGNDEEISKIVSQKIKVKNVYETNIVLKLILEIF
jgi:2-phospho-L-lactate transferase/gluconeogenesis factor (CofD/UPF0052 family)